MKCTGATLTSSWSLGDCADGGMARGEARRDRAEPRQPYVDLYRAASFCVLLRQAVVELHPEI